ncbi:MAG TPA: phosphoribosylformylglycinamidine cyclo-ligase [Candidatus Desulfofervidus auxilii]|uniref:Phosphoribosylformylglycinamidine cyclo-ligase n=1 Tax=Desulfofervidus auxilii TaxID=1621989 RepID=A0A7V0NE47_DESA2|nr:phosphoribosylformylglycinamidine cyclo-ligase [Candidatus Desulfofervidus auxilii]
MEEELSYEKAGVSLKRADEALSRIKSLIKGTYQSSVLYDIGHFAAFFAFDKEKYNNPVLVSATDGVGTKLKIAFMLDKHDTVGIDLVAMCANDIIVHGATPLFFLDYIATGYLSPEKVEQIMKGIVEGCNQANCAIIGGEMAEMPDFYNVGEYDLAGFIVGVVNRDKIIDGSEISVGYKIIGLASSGLHSNGYSLVRKLFFEKLNWSLDRYLDTCQCTLGEELLKPTRIYVQAILNILRDFRIGGMAHITGGGIVGNISRILPKGCKAVIEKGSWDIPPIFEIIQQTGRIKEEEMLYTFNCGIGLILIVSPKDVNEIIDRLKGLKEIPYIIGEIAKREEEEPAVMFV